MEKQLALQMKGITKRFGGIVANNHVDLDVYRGEILAILGENGCGKTTLSRVLASTEPEKEFPTCEIHWTTKPIQTLVYNKDFRDRNLSENIPGVFTLGEQRVDTRGLIIDVSGYPTGIYFIKAFVEGNWYSRKVIVR